MKCAFVTFENMNDAMRARQDLDSTLIGTAMIRVSFAKESSSSSFLQSHSEIDKRFQKNQQFILETSSNSHPQMDSLRSMNTLQSTFKGDIPDSIHTSAAQDAFQSSIFSSRLNDDMSGNRERSSSISSTSSIPATMNTSPNLYYPSIVSNGSKFALPFVNKRSLKFNQSNEVFNSEFTDIKEDTVLFSKSDSSFYPDHQNMSSLEYNLTQDSITHSNANLSIESQYQKQPAYQINQIATPNLLAMAGIPSHPLVRPPKLSPLKQPSQTRFYA